MAVPSCLLLGRFMFISHHCEHHPSTGNSLQSSLQFSQYSQNQHHYAPPEMGSVPVSGTWVPTSQGLFSRLLSFFSFYFLQYNLLIFQLQFTVNIILHWFPFPFLPLSPEGGHCSSHLCVISVSSVCLLSPLIPVSAISPLIPSLPLMKSLWCFAFLPGL